MSIHREKPRFISRGAFGEVFKVETYEAIRDIKIFAAKKIKFFKTDQNDKMYKSFLKELGTSSSIVKLNHINVVQYFDAWLERDKEFGKLYFYIIMEYCDYSLKAKIKEIKTNTILKENNHLSYVGFCIAIEIFIQILEGVSHLHKQKQAIIHRDLKPSNILFKEEEESVFVKIGDYGLVALHKFTDNLVDEQTGGSDELHSNQVGDQNYAAPEVIDGQEYDTKADIYSIANVSMDLFRVNKKRYVS
jgi:serine/threonine protein kinase